MNPIEKPDKIISINCKYCDVKAFGIKIETTYYYIYVTIEHLEDFDNCIEDFGVKIIGEKSDLIGNVIKNVE